MPADTLPAELQPLHNWAKRIEEAVLRCELMGNWHKGDFNAGLYRMVELWAWNLPYAPDNAEETALVHLASKYPTHEQGLRGKLAKCDQVRERVRRQQERWEFPPKDLYAAEELIVEAGRFAHQINCVVDAIAKETQQAGRPNDAGGAAQAAPASDTPRPADVADGRPAKRRGRLSKQERQIKLGAMFAKLTQHPSLKDDPVELAAQVGIGESTARRWLAEGEEKYRQSRAANPDAAKQ